MTLVPVAPPAASLRLLGGVSLLVDGEPRLARRLKTVALLGCLARAPGSRCRRARLADLFWGDAGDERARHSLRQALADLRRHLGPAIRSTPDEAWLERDAVAVDVDAFEAALGARDWEGAVAAWAGDFLAGADQAGTPLFAEWLAEERAALREGLATACASLVSAAREAGDADAALGHAERWVALLPRDERAHRAVVELLAQTGRTGEAAIAHTAALSALEPADGASSEFVRLAGTLVSMSRAARRAAPAARAPEIAGRAALGDVLDTALARLDAGEGAVIAIEGEEGLGKTHALQSLEARLAMRLPGSRLRSARALAAERRDAAALLRRLAGVEPGHADPAGVLTRLLGTATAEQPLALLVDDAGLADDASQGWLAQVARAVPRHVLLVLAMRPLALNDTRFRPAFRQNAALRAVQLGPLTLAETAALVRERYPASERDVAVLAERVRRDARGIPAVAVAILGLLDEEDYLVRAGEQWRLARELPIGGLCLPADARERARRQLPKLSADARALVEIAATAGEVVDERLVLRVAALTEPAAALAELDRRRLLVATTHAAGALEFTAAGVRQSVLDQLTPARREQLRRAVEHAQKQLRDAGHRGALPRVMTESRPRFSLLRATLGIAGRLTGVAALIR